MSTENKSPDVELVPPPKPAGALGAVGLALLVLGGALCIAALFGEDTRVRLGFSYLVGYGFLWSIVLGSLLFVGLYHLSNATWAIVVRRVVEMFATPMVAVAVLFLPVVVFLVMNSQFHLFEWADKAHVAEDEILQWKQPYLNIPFFLVRAVFFFAVWIAFTRFFVRGSIKQDDGGDTVSLALRMRKWSPLFVMLFGLTATFAAIDWYMSLTPHWFSTIYGVYVFSGMVLSSLACVTIAVILLNRSGRLPESVFTRDHLYNLGAFLFGFVCFWGYIAFSQYMLIWYANIPEETFYFTDRLQGPWAPVTVALFVVRFAIPFILLLARRAKMNTTLLLAVSLIVLAGQLLDLYWLVMPQVHQAGPVLSWPEIGPTILMIGVLLWSVSRFLGKHWILAIGDPRLERSLHFHL